ncbi:MAG: F0F1 ATP synthase subunit B [Gemmatimonas sp.]|nr:F0F1 ATP synthase subunit B [Gemmatimonas sp.]
MSAPDVEPRTALSPERMMQRFRRRLTPLLLVATAKPAAAQEGGLLDPDPGLMVWTVVIFLIVLAILYKLAFPHILGAVEAREARIRELLEEAASDREAAEAALAEHNRQLEETRARIHELVAEGRTAGERVRDEIIVDARSEAEEIMGRARRDVRQELENAMQEMRMETVDIAIAAASKLVERNLDAEDNRRLVREYLAEIESGSGASAVAGV